MFYINEFCHIDSIHFTFEKDQSVAFMSILFKYERNGFESVFESNCDATGWRKKWEEFSEYDFMSLADYPQVERYFEDNYQEYLKNNLLT